MNPFEMPAAADLDPTVAPVWHAVDFARPRVLKLIEELTPEQLAQCPAGFKNSLASLVAHCARANVSFAHQILSQPVPDELKAEFHLDQPSSPIYQPAGETFATLSGRWEKSHAILRAALATLKAGDENRVLSKPQGFDLTLRWLLSLITFHTPDHYGQMIMIKQHLPG